MKRGLNYFSYSLHQRRVSKFLAVEWLCLAFMACGVCFGAASVAPKAFDTNAAKEQWEVWKERMRAEALKERSAYGPWKQVAVIASPNWMESLPVAASSSTSNVPLHRSGNHNLVTFLDNHRLLVADGDHPIRVFDADTGALLKSFGDPLPDDQERRSLVVLKNDSVITSPGARWITIMPSREPKIWDTRTGECVATLPRFEEMYSLAAFYADGRRLVTYRGGMLSRGQVADNLQIWEVTDQAHRAVLLRGINADTDARGLRIVGPYLLVQGYRHSEVLDAEGFNVLTCSWSRNWSQFGNRSENRRSSQSDAFLP